MHKTHNSSNLAKQVAEKLDLNQEDGLRLYKELSQIPNGFVKDALDALTQDTASKKYVACIKGTCVRDAQYATHDDAEPLDDNSWRDAQYATHDDAEPLDDNSWRDATEVPLFLGIVEAETSVRAKQIIAAREGVNENVIMLTEI